jgi:ElaB/YqjD/DUF883 family membrane-anchored ribosome-binding protein
MASPESISTKSTDPAARVEQVLDTGNETLGDLKQRVDRFADDLRYTVRESAETKPISTLAIAIAVGFVLGAFWKS